MNGRYEKLMTDKPELFYNSGEKETIHIITDPEFIAKVEKQTGREAGIVFEDDYIRLLRDAVIFPDGSAGTYIRIVPRAEESAVAVLTVIGGKILLLRHYRHSLRKAVWESPRGIRGARAYCRRECPERTGGGNRNLWSRDDISRENIS